MIAFQFGPIKIAYYGIMITLGLIAAMVVAHIEARRRLEDTKHLYNLVLVVLPLSLIGARLYHVIDQWSYYSQHPLAIIGGAGLGIFGAVIGGVIGLVLYTRWQKISTLRWLDIIAPGAILAQGIGRWGNYFNQELYGYPTNLPWGIYIDPQHRLPGYENFSHFHPLFLYESLWDLSGCAVLLIVARKWGRSSDSDIFLLYVIYYSVGRFLLEGLKIGVWTVEGIPTARWITGIAVAAATGILVYRHNRQRSNTPSPPGQDIPHGI